MDFVVGKQHKIFESIVAMNTVDVVDNFFWRKITSKMFLHYKPMFSNRTSFIGKRMFWFRNIDVSVAYLSPPFPVRCQT